MRRRLKVGRPGTATLGWAAMILAPAFGLTAGLTAADVEFSRDVRPILSDKCFTCHGPDETKRLSGLRLDTEEGVMKDLGGRFAVSPGRPDESEVWKRISHENDALKMPPVYAPKQLTAEEAETIREWIEQGAKYESHWAFSAPRKAPFPDVKHAEWARNAVDRFVLARVEAEGMEPSAEAERAELLRRVSFDVTGLPPTPAELDRFLADDSPGAYEQAVDRLLDSPR